MLFLNTIMEFMSFYALDLFHSITFIVILDIETDSSLASGSPFQVGSKSFWHDSSWLLIASCDKLSYFIVFIFCSRSEITTSSRIPEIDLQGFLSVQRSAWEIKIEALSTTLFLILSLFLISPNLLHQEY